MKDWDVTIYRGILTGYNEAFIIDQPTRDQLVQASAKNAEIIRPIIMGKSIKKYQVIDENLWIIFIPWHFPLENKLGVKGASKEAEDQFIIEYPEIYEHLLKFKKALSNRNPSETGIRYEWYALQRFGSTYYKDFDKPKITWGNLALEPQFAFSDSKSVINAPSPFITTDDLYLLAMLNSILTKFYISRTGVSRNGGYVEYKPMFVEKLPIPNLPEKMKKIICDLVKEIIELKKNKKPSKIKESQIDKIFLDFLNFDLEERESIIT